VGDSTPRSLDVQLTHSFPVTVEEAFAYITDVGNWHEYWPGFVRLENPERASWAVPGDSLTIVVKLLGRETALHLTLEELGRNELVRYRSRQDRLPPARHERRFTPTSAGFDYTLLVSYEPRRGLAGVFDRTLVKRAIASALHKTVDNLERVFAGRPGA
jgi:Polyketide cyclase / dehydrase and lipid transport